MVFFFHLAIIVRSSEATLPFETLVDNSGNYNFPVTSYK